MRSPIKSTNLWHNIAPVHGATTSLGWETFGQHHHIAKTVSSRQEGWCCYYSSNPGPTNLGMFQKSFGISWDFQTQLYKLTVLHSRDCIWTTSSLTNILLLYCTIQTIQLHVSEGKRKNWNLLPVVIQKKRKKPSVWRGISWFDNVDKHSIANLYIYISVGMATIGFGTHVI